MILKGSQKRAQNVAKKAKQGIQGRISKRGIINKHTPGIEKQQ